MSEAARNGIAMRTRKAMTLVELLVVLAIIGVLVAILLAGVMQARWAALQVQSMNNLRQCSLALQTFADDHSGKLPGIFGGSASPNEGFSLFFALLPYVEEDNYYHAVKDGSAPNSSNHTVKPFIDPADPTVAKNWPDLPGLASYAANACALEDGSALPKSFPDGTSNTIAFAEHYAFNCAKTQFNWFTDLPIPFPNGAVMHRATFADFDPRAGRPYDLQADDVYPVRRGNPPTSVGSIPALTFQVRPRVSECDPRIPQTPYNAMPVALADGSVRTLSRGMSATTFWAAVTPAGGEVLGADW